LYFHNMRYKENMSSETIFSFFPRKISLYKTSNFKTVQLRHIRIKIVIVIVLKPNMRVDLRQGRVMSRVGSVSIGIIVIIIVLKPDLRVNLGQGSGHISEGSM